MTMSSRGTDTVSVDEDALKGIDTVLADKDALKRHLMLTSLFPATEYSALHYTRTFSRRDHIQDLN